MRPWPISADRARGDDARFGKDALPPEEGAALWQAFDAEMHWLYAIMNEGKKVDAGV